MSAPEIRMAAEHRQMLSVLESARVEYVLVGGVAMQIYGVSVSTRDVDIVIAANDGNHSRLNDALGRLRAGPAVAVSQTGSTFSTALGQLEVLNDTTGMGGYSRWAPRAKPVELEPGLTVRVADPADIEHNKLAAGREKDHRHVELLRRALAPRSPEGEPRPAVQRLLGDPPLDAQARRTWDAVAAVAERFRQANEIGEDGHPLGPAVDGPVGAERDRILRLARSTAPDAVRELEASGPADVVVDVDAAPDI